MKAFVMRTFWETLTMTVLIFLVMLGLVLASNYIPKDPLDDDAIDDNNTIVASSDAVEPVALTR